MVKIPKIAKEIEIYHQDPTDLLLLGLKQIKIYQSLALYKEGMVSLWKAVRTAGISLRQMIGYAIAEGLKPRITQKTLKEEIS